MFITKRFVSDERNRREIRIQTISIVTEKETSKFNALFIIDKDSFKSVNSKSLNYY